MNLIIKTIGIYLLLILAFALFMGLILSIRVYPIVGYILLIFMCVYIFVVWPLQSIYAILKQKG